MANNKALGKLTLFHKYIISGTRTIILMFEWQNVSISCHKNNEKRMDAYDIGIKLHPITTVLQNFGERNTIKSLSNQVVHSC